MPIHAVVDRLFLPLALAIVLILGQAAYLVRRSVRIDSWPVLTKDDLAGQAAARAALASARRIWARAAFTALTLVALLFSGIALLNQL